MAFIHCVCKICTSLLHMIQHGICTLKHVSQITKCIETKFIRYQSSFINSILSEAITAKEIVEITINNLIMNLNDDRAQSHDHETIIADIHK